jgi:hypothetical protein
LNHDLNVATGRLWPSCGSAAVNLTAEYRSLTSMDTDSLIYLKE